MRERLVTVLKGILVRKGMDGYLFELSGAIVPEERLGMVGGWLLILGKRTGLIGANAYVAVSATLPTGYPTEDQMQIVVMQLNTQLGTMHRQLMGFGNGSGSQGSS